MTCGPYRPITLMAYTSRIQDVHTRAVVDVKPDGSFIASLKVDVTLEGAWCPGSALIVTFSDSESREIKSDRVQVREWEEDGTHSSFVQESVVTWSGLQNNGVELWWPVGYGTQTLYSVRVSLVSSVSTTSISWIHVEELTFY